MNTKSGKATDEDTGGLGQRDGSRTHIDVPRRRRERSDNDDDSRRFLRAIVSGNPYDIVLMTIGLPDPEAGFELFELVQEHYPDAPVVGACPQSEVFHVVRFMANGMSAHVTRDSGGDYIFMLSAYFE